MSNDSWGLERPLRLRVLVVIFNPGLRSYGGRSLVEVCGYNDPQHLMESYIADLAEVSGGLAQYELAEVVRVDGFPRKADGFCYDESTFMRCFREGRGWHEPDAVDYLEIVRETDIVRRVETGEAHELWLWGPPYAGFWESTMAGSGAFFCNSDPVTGVACSRRFIIMGFNYERGTGEMLENFGHRVESIMARRFGSWREWGGHDGHAWDQFTAYDLVAPGRAGCGTVHFAPNSERDYDWGNPRPVWSTCDSWLEYPYRQPRARLVDCHEWGGGDIRAHHKWWLAHLPRSRGRTGGTLNNWWTYVLDPNLV